MRAFAFHAHKGQAPLAVRLCRQQLTHNTGVEPTPSRFVPPPETLVGVRRGGPPKRISLNDDLRGVGWPRESSRRRALGISVEK